MVPPDAFVLPVMERIPAALRIRELPEKFVVLAVLPERLMPVKLDVPE